MIDDYSLHRPLERGTAVNIYTDQVGPSFNFAHHLNTAHDALPV